MDPALWREREQFRKRAMAIPVVERKKNEESTTSRDDKGKFKFPGIPPSASSTKVATNPVRFGVLAKVVNYMKNRHLHEDFHPLTLDEILEELNQLDVVPLKTKQWLDMEALRNNPKIDVVEGIKYIYKPPLKIKNSKMLLKLLKEHDLKGKGGIYLDDIRESLPNSDRALRKLDSDIVYITRPSDKKSILFYRDPPSGSKIDDEIRKLWLAVSVKEMDEDKIEEYLEKQGVKSMPHHGIKKKFEPIGLKRKQFGNKNRHGKKITKDNEHVESILENYD